MNLRVGARGICGLVMVLLAVANVSAAQTSEPQAEVQQAATAGSAGAVAGLGTPATIACSSMSGERVYCAGNTADGVLLLKSTGTGECILGRTWGYDEKGIWVSGGCSAEFASSRALTPQGSGQPATSQPASGQQPNEPTPRIETWGEFDPGDGFLVGRNSKGELAISAYALIRFIDQTPGTETYTDHLGNERQTDARKDVFPHRIIVYLKGWLGTPKLVYTLFFWTVSATDQRAIFINLGYQYSRKFSIYAGIAGNPGTRSMQGSHPYWLGHDRVMADEFFRPYFGSGVWAQGEALPGFWYNVQVSNSNSQLGVTAAQLDRSFATGGSVWWTPTTKEFGPRGGFGDYEWHEKLATRFGMSTTQSREQRYTNVDTPSAQNTTLRLADGVNVFDTGSLAPGVTIDLADFRILSFDAGMKYKGFFLQTEIYHRWLDDFKANGPLPVSSVLDRGFYIQGSFYPIKKKLELYGATSQIYGDKDAGFSDSSEYLGGANFYPFDTRNHRLNFQVIKVNRSPVSSTFGYYTAGQKGWTSAVGFSVLF